MPIECDEEEKEEEKKYLKRKFCILFFFHSLHKDAIALNKVQLKSNDSGCKHCMHDFKIKTNHKNSKTEKVENT